MSPAPIALFVYRRPEHTRQCLEHLRANPLATQSDLFIFSDGPKNEAAREGVALVRILCRQVAGFRSVRIVEQRANLGLAKSIIAGVTKIVEEFGEVIVLEDDLLTSPHFLQYMNEALRLYHDQPQVVSIHGYVYPVRGRLPETFLLRGADCWGWATWKRGWAVFDADGQKLLDRIRKSDQARALDCNGSYPYTRMLEEQIAGKNDSWAVRWYASAFLAGKLTLYPGRPLVQNIGMDALGTHCGETDVFNERFSCQPVTVAPLPIEENTAALRLFEMFFRSMQPSIIQRIANKMRRIFSAQPV